MASAGSIVGDQIGYAIGRWGGTALVSRCVAILGGGKRMAQAEAKARQWGAWGVFFSRWLVSPLGPWINFASGIAGYPWLRFVIWDVLGEVLGVVIFVVLGRMFSDRILALDSVLGDFAWALVALLAAVVLGWKIWKANKNKTP